MSPTCQSCYIFQTAGHDSFILDNSICAHLRHVDHYHYFLYSFTHVVSNIQRFYFLLQVARAGRFGTKGLAITFVSDEKDAKVLNEVQDRFEVNVGELPEEIDLSSYSK